MTAQKRTTAPPKSIQKAFSYIRFSTVEQARGHSFQRQFQQTVEYAKRRGVQLDAGTRFLDSGVSAFKGANRNSGAALGNFLQSVKSGQIPKDSILIVESLDRLSREEIMKSVTTFMEILGHGIEVVTLSDGERSFTSESVNKNPTELMLSIMVLGRAHEESKMKSLRIGAAWKAKRETPDKKLTARSPAWVQLSKDRSSFHLIPERASIIRRVFDLASKGVGKDQIARLFNKEGLASWRDGKRGGNGWHKSYIQKILTSRAVIGEFQPHKMREGKRVPEGEPIQNYFPQVIDPKLFASVQMARFERRSKGGRKGPKRSNLFTHIAKCGYCGGSMVYINKGGKEHYLACDRAKRGLGCGNKSWGYFEFESHFLWYAGIADLSRLVPTDKESERKTVARKNKELESRLQEVRVQRADLVKALVNNPSLGRTVVSIINQFDQDEDALQKELIEGQNHIRSLEVKEQSLDQRFTMLRELLRPENQLIRREWLANELARYINCIRVFGDGYGESVRAKKASRLNILLQSRRFMEIQLKNSVSIILSEGASSENLHRSIIKNKGKKSELLSEADFAKSGLEGWTTTQFRFLDKHESKIVLQVSQLIKEQRTDEALELLWNTVKNRQKLLTAIYCLLCDQLPVSEEETRT